MKKNILLTILAIFIVATAGMYLFSVSNNNICIFDGTNTCDIPYELSNDRIIDDFKLLLEFDRVPEPNFRPNQSFEPVYSVETQEATNSKRIFAEWFLVPINPDWGEVAELQLTTYIDGRVICFHDQDSADIGLEYYIVTKEWDGGIRVGNENDVDKNRDIYLIELDSLDLRVIPDHTHEFGQKLLFGCNNDDGDIYDDGTYTASVQKQHIINNSAKLYFLVGVERIISREGGGASVYDVKFNVSHKKAIYPQDVELKINGKNILSLQGEQIQNKELPDIANVLNKECEDGQNCLLNISLSSKTAGMITYNIVDELAVKTGNQQTNDTDVEPTQTDAPVDDSSDEPEQEKDMETKENVVVGSVIGFMILLLLYVVYKRK